jgi:hypothetical protein
MNRNRLIAIFLLVALSLGAAADQALAQQPVSQSNDANGSARSGDDVQLSKLLAQARTKRRPFFSLMPEIGNPSITEPMFINPAAAPLPPVNGSGTLGRLTKWGGFTSSNSVIADSTVYEDKFGKVGIGTDSPTSKLTVAGLIEASGPGGGVKFPDGTVQTTSASSALFTVVHDETLTGDGTTASPLSVVASDSLIEPVSGEVGFVIDPGSGGIQSSIYSVPAGKRLVIEHVSAICSLPIGQRLSRVSIGARPSQGVPFPVVHQLVPSHILDSQDLQLSRLTASLAIRLYAHSGTNVEILLARIVTTGVFSCGVSFSGFLVDLPQPAQ